MKDITAYDANGNKLEYINQYSENVTAYVSDSLITKAYDIKFYNSETSRVLTSSGTYSNGMLSAKIPDILMQSSLPIFGYIITNPNSKSKDNGVIFSITIREKDAPADYLFVTRNDYRMITDVYEDMKEYVDDSGGGGGGSDVEALSIDEIDRILV